MLHCMSLTTYPRPWLRACTPLLPYNMCSFMSTAPKHGSIRLYWIWQKYTGLMLTLAYEAEFLQILCKSVIGRWRTVQQLLWHPNALSDTVSEDSNQADPQATHRLFSRQHWYPGKASATCHHWNFTGTVVHTIADSLPEFLHNARALLY